MKKVLNSCTSIWKAHCQNIDFPELTEDIEVDVAIIGGGITGISCAHLLARSGRRVAVLEAWKIGEGTTGNSTGNLYGVVDERLDEVKSKFDAETAGKVTKSRMEALAFIENNIANFNIECDFGRQPWYLFTGSEDKIEAIDKEYEAYTEAGLETSLSMDLPFGGFEVEKALKIEGQAQFNPLAYVKKYAQAIHDEDCMIFENTVVNEIDIDTTTLHTPKGKVTAKYIIHATHSPKGIAPVQTLLGPYR